MSIHPRDLAQYRRRWEAIAEDGSDFRSDRTANLVIMLLDEIDNLRRQLEAAQRDGADNAAP